MADSLAEYRIEFRCRSVARSAVLRGVAAAAACGLVLWCAVFDRPAGTAAAVIALLADKNEQSVRRSVSRTTEPHYTGHSSSSGGGGGGRGRYNRRRAGLRSGVRSRCDRFILLGGHSNGRSGAIASRRVNICGIQTSIVSLDCCCCCWWWCSWDEAWKDAGRRVKARVYCGRLRNCAVCPATATATRLWSSALSASLMDGDGG